MGSRTVAPAPPAPAERSAAAGFAWAALLALLAGVLGLAVLVPRPVAATGALASPLAGALLFAIACASAAVALRRRLGAWAPLWVAVWGGASVAWASAVWTPHAMLGLASTALAYAVLEGRTAPPPPVGELPDVWTDAVSPARASWAEGLAGLLLGIPIALHPLYAVLLLPAILLAPPPRGRAALLLLGGAGVAAAAGTLLFGDPGAWLGDLRAPELDLGLISANVRYLFFGRQVGLLIYFLPVLLGLAALGQNARRAAFFAAALIGALGFAILRPFDFIDAAREPHAIANAAFLPLYPALWFWPGRRAKAVPALLIAGLAAPWLLPLWTGATRGPFGDDGRWRYVAPLAERYLPLETTLRTMPGVPEVGSGALRVRPVSGAVPVAGGFAMLGGVPARLLIASPLPVAAFYVEFDRQASTTLEAEGAGVGPTTLRADGRVAFTLTPGKPRAVHPMWWTHERQHLYELRLDLKGAPAVPIRFTFRLAGQGAAR